MSQLITQAYFQEQMATLGIKSSFAPSSDQLDTLITEASDWVENYCDRVFALTTIIETRRGPQKRWSNRLILDQWPVQSITSVTWESELSLTGGYAANLFRVLPGGVVEFKNSMHGPWYYDYYYTVTYVAGYTEIPSNVQRATALKIANLIQPQYQGPQDREVFMVTNLESMIVDLLEPYRRERLG